MLCSGGGAASRGAVSWASPVALLQTLLHKLNFGTEGAASSAPRP